MRPTRSSGHEDAQALGQIFDFARGFDGGERGLSAGWYSSVSRSMAWISFFLADALVKALAGFSPSQPRSIIFL
jgi:hypothetical protein